MMKIGNTSGAAAGIGQVGNASGGAREASGTGSTSPAAKVGNESAKVTLSSAANALFEGSTEGSFDAEKVDRIRQSIANGTYQVNHEAIADKLIANAQELLGKVSGN
jgi:negative regulator of flagellin synthesis FlgM